MNSWPQRLMRSDRVRLMLAGCPTDTPEFSFQGPGNPQIHANAACVTNKNSNPARPAMRFWEKMPAPVKYI